MAAHVILKIAEKFVSQGVLSNEKLESSKRLALDSGKRLDLVLIEEGLLTEEELLKAFSEELDITFETDISHSEVPREYVEKPWPISPLTSSAEPVWRRR